MKLRYLASVCLFLFSATSIAQNVLHTYIKEGLESNHSLKQKQLSYQRSVLDLKQARAMFYPDISFNARYSVAEGGRTIEFPVGDLLNPVYQSLNTLMQINKFPEIKNQEFYFLRPTDQETKLSLVQPLFNTDIYYNNKIKQDMLKAAEVDVEAYKRELIAEIKTAYYSWLQALQLVEIYNQSLELLAENLRVNKSLYKNEKVTLDVVYRSEAELSKIHKEMATAEKNLQLARAYFNFLLNRPLDEAVERAEPETLPISELELSCFSQHAVANREELKRLDHLLGANERNLQRNKGAYLPRLTAAVDYGIQGEEYYFNDEYDFLLASLVLNWKLFDGKNRDYELQKARLDNEILQETKHQAAAKIKMEVMQAYYSMIASARAIKAAEDELQSASRAFKLIKAKYEQGQASFLEFIDANTAVKSAKISKSVAEYQFFSDHASFEKAAAISKTDY